MKRGIAGVAGVSGVSGDGGRPARTRIVLSLLLAVLAGCSTIAAPPPAQPGNAEDFSVGARDRVAAQPAAPSAAEPSISVVTRAPATPAPATPAPVTPVPQPEPFAFNLFEDGDFVPQYTFDWCVAASIQMAYNMATDGSRTERGDQQQLWERARDLSSNSFRGANPHGWTAVLNELGIGPYELVAIPDYEEALRMAAAAIRDTDRPVGLVMWRGRHAWVMNGFESVGDPARFDAFQVTGVRVSDPLYPYGSGVWGPSPAPNSLLTPDELASQFVIREPRRWSGSMPAGYLMVLPVSVEVAVQRSPPENA